MRSRLIEQHHVETSINKGDRWTVEELVEKSAELFGDRNPGLQQRFPVSSGAAELSVAEVRWTKNVGPAEITKISVGRMDNNVYLIAVGDEVGVVDAGSDDVEGVLGAVGDRKLAKVLQTHDHGDHIATLKEIVSKTGAPVYAHAKSDLPVKAEPIDDGDTIDVGGVTLKVLYTPGHTPGGVSFLLQEAGESHLFAGDTLVPRGAGATWNNAENFRRSCGRSTRSCSRCPTTRTSTPDTASTRRSGRNARASRSGGPAATSGDYARRTTVAPPSIFRSPFSLVTSRSMSARCSPSCS